ncbi:MAG: AmmeMemoRadiSam system protein A [Chloroflexi bacterium]|nr:AmmeMemoRadiSam system protein A [Chloroflexota bacterium]
MGGIVYACIVPHPPVLVPQIGRGREKEIEATTRAMQTVAQDLATQQPQTLMVISPHGRSHPKAMGILTAKTSRGTLAEWGAWGLDYSFPNDLELVSLIQEECRGAGVPLKSIGERDYDLDHGVLVPISFLVKEVKDCHLVPLTFSGLPLTAHFAFGQAIAQAAARSQKSIALVASGDLSHRLLPHAPAGYDPMGQVFDQKLTELVAAGDAPGILNLDAQLIQRAGECGLRSIVILMGALQIPEARPRVLSYEGTFGVGYLVACFHIPASGGDIRVEGEIHPLVRLARDTVVSFVLRQPLPDYGGLLPTLGERAGVFVSIKKLGELRGCIGTLEPVRHNVVEEVAHNAISAAIRDPRFPPVTPAELPYLSFSVDVLSPPEPVTDHTQLDPKRYGIIVERGRRRGLLLPDLEGINTGQEQICIACHKAGIPPEGPITLYRFETKRYY